MHDRLADDRRELLGAALAADARGELRAVPQRSARANSASTTTRSRAPLTRPFGKDDRVLPPYATAREAVDRIRSLAPKPGRAIDRGAASRRRHDAAAAVQDPARARQPGVAAGRRPRRAERHGRRCRGYLYVRASDAWIVVDEVVPAGKPAMTIDAFANGRRIDDVFVPEDDVVDGLGALRFRERAGELLAR